MSCDHCERLVCERFSYAVPNSTGPCACPCHTPPVWAYDPCAGWRVEPIPPRLGRITKVEVVRDGGTFTIPDPDPGPEIRLTGDLAKLPAPPPFKPRTVAGQALQKFVERGFHIGLDRSQTMSPAPEREPEPITLESIRSAVNATRGIPMVPSPSVRQGECIFFNPNDAPHVKALALPTTEKLFSEVTRLRDQLGERDHRIAELEREIGRLSLENRRPSRKGVR